MKTIAAPAASLEAWYPRRISLGASESKAVSAAGGFLCVEGGRRVSPVLCGPAQGTHPRVVRRVESRDALAGVKIQQLQRKGRSVDRDDEGRGIESGP